MTRTSQFDLGSGLDADLAYQWDTERKLFSLADVRALPSAVLVVLFFFFKTKSRLLEELEHRTDQDKIVIQI